MKLHLPCGRIAFLDNADAHLLLGYRWHASPRKNTAYVCGRLPGQHGGGVYLHHLITGFAQTDHTNGNGLDNRRSNLRPCTTAENSRNPGKKNPAKRFKSVYFSRKRQTWWAQLYVGDKVFHSNRHNTEEEAARAYDALARKHHGAFARLNFPEIVEPTS